MRKIIFWAVCCIFFSLLTACLQRKSQFVTQSASTYKMSGYVKSGNGFQADHAALDPRHVQTAEAYIDTKLKSNGQYDLEKVKRFQDQLEREKKALASDLYETKLIEKLEMEVTSLKKAKKSALKKQDEKKSALLIAYSRYLIPRIVKLKELVQAGIVDQRADAMLDEFLAIYTVFFLPKAPRNMWNKDLDYVAIAKNLAGYVFKKDDTDKVHANNLTVNGESQEAIQGCFNQNVTVGQYLTEGQLQQLTTCGFDLSRLNPGKSPFWRMVTAETVDEVKDLHSDWFPTEDEKIYYDHVKYSSAGSPKIEGYFKRNGQKIDLKIKFGFEVHTEIASSILGRLLGFQHDPVHHRPLVKMYLKDTTLSGFKAQWERKYEGKNKEWATYMHSHGQDSSGTWVVFRDAQLSVDDRRMIKLGPYQPEGWDLANRREHRAMVLWYGWLSMIDTKAGNHRAMLEKLPDRLRAVYELSDPGYSLNLSVDLRHPWHLFRSIGRWGVNNYHPSFLSWDEGKVHIWWAEAMLGMERFSTATYFDVKWMARRIAAISYEDIKYAVNSAGFPDDVADLYIHKITNRRNEAVQAFGLESEYPIYPVADLDNYSPNENVKNGSIVASHFEGHAGYELTRNSVFPYILSFLSQSMNLSKLHAELSAKISDTVDLSGNIGKKIWEGVKGKVFSVTGISPGLKVSLKRQVDSNNAFVNYENESQAFYVKDTISLELDITTGLFGKIADQFPVSGSGRVKVWRRDFEMIQFGDTWAKAYSRGVKILPFVVGWKNMVTQRLNAGELFKVSDSYGMDFSITVGLPDSVGIEAKAGVGYSWLTTAPVYVYRDSFGQLSVYRENESSQTVSARMGIANIDAYIVDLPVLDLNWSYKSFKGQGELYKFSMPQYDIGLSALDYNQRQADYQALQKLLHEGNDDVTVLAHQELNLETTGWMKTFKAWFLLFWKKDGSEGYSQATVKLPEGKSRLFHRYYVKKKGLLGSDELISFEGNQSISVLQRNMRSLAIEMDETDPTNMMILLDVGDYHRKLDLEELKTHIADVNELFSQNEEQLFFRDYVLPSKDEVDVYRKLYTQIRIYIQGSAIYSRFMKMSDEDIEKIAREYSGYTRYSSITYSPNEDDADFDAYQSYQTLFSDLRYSRNILNEDKDDPEKFLGAVSYLINRLTERRNIFSTKIKHHEKGVGLLKTIFGTKSLFVYGEIFGVFPSFSTLQQNEAVVKRRFAGKSWGSFKVIPPIRQFLHENKLTPSTIFVKGGLGLKDIFGQLPEPRSVDFY